MGRVTGVVAALFVSSTCWSDEEARASITLGALILPLSMLALLLTMCAYGIELCSVTR